MKKLITICLLIATTFTVNAQDAKPTKEQTITFIKNQLASMIGTKYMSNNLITKYSFETDKIYFEFSDEMVTSTYTYSQLNWVNLVGESRAGNEIILAFKSAIKEDYKAFGKSSGAVVNSGVKNQQYIQIPLPSDKFDSLSKAFLRLSEIAKEENKDPFEK
jgi:hypothetical protein